MFAFPAVALTEDDEEPCSGSVVLLHGASGTAFQRFFVDGLWHGTNGQREDFAALQRLARSRRQPLLLVYSPD